MRDRESEIKGQRLWGWEAVMWWFFTTVILIDSWLGSWCPSHFNVFYWWTFLLASLIGRHLMMAKPFSTQSNASYAFSSKNGFSNLEANFSKPHCKNQLCLYNHNFQMRQKIFIHIDEQLRNVWVKNTAAGKIWRILLYNTQCSTVPFAGCSHRTLHGTEI